MKKILLLLCLFLAACGNDTTTMVCGEHNVKYTMSPDGETLTAIIDDNDVTLNIAISASGARYVGKMQGQDVTLWNHQSDWMMFFNEDAPITCIVK